MSLATYSVDRGPDGGSVLYRFVPVVRRPRGDGDDNAFLGSDVELRNKRA